MKVMLVKKTLTALMLLALFLFAACERPHEVTFMLDGAVYETVGTDAESTLERVPMPELETAYFLGWYDEAYTERFDADSKIEEDLTLYAKTEPYDGETLLTPLTDRLSLDPSDYENRSFPEDGIGEAELERCIDGDTTHFTADGMYINARYLNIDTPESTGRIEPWGMASSDFVCDVLEDAVTIVLEYEPHPEKGHLEEHPTVGRLGTFGRHLTYIWYDGRLLNLELIEKAYTAVSASGLSQYGYDMMLAQHNAEMTSRHIHTESDPLFEKPRLEPTVEEVLASPEDYMHRFMDIEGEVESLSGSSMILNDEGASIYVYLAGARSQRLQEGARVRLENVFLREWQGSIQLTNVGTDRIRIIN